MTDSTINATAPRWRPSTVAMAVTGAVLLASLGASAGWLMRGEAPAPTAAAEAQAPAALQMPAKSVPPVADDEVAPPPTKSAAVRAEERAPSHKPAPVRAPARHATPAPSHDAAPVRTVAVCQTCGTVEGVTEIRQKGEANGVGAVGGAVVGAVLGNQVGGGNGRKAMTVLGAVGGGLAGHEIEKQARAETLYQVHVRMDNGATRTVTVKNAPAAGARVVVEGESLRPAS